MRNWRMAHGGPFAGRFRSSRPCGAVFRTGVMAGFPQPPRVGQPWRWRWGFATCSTKQDCCRCGSCLNQNVFMTAQIEATHGRNFSVAQAGEWAELSNYTFNHSLIGKVPGKLFLKEPLRLTGMEVSLGVIPAGHGMPFLHAHRQNEELYIFVKGQGQFVVDGEVLEIREGSVVRVAPDGARAWRNTSKEDLFYIVIQARAGTLANGTITDGIEVPGPLRWPQDERC